ncbi:hypothetical protein [Nigerium massiliense]|uniref:hypothetical protein n=1 Tax=Nigerium massiliense TaxID=1522317 RepID=UPI00058E5851|nr:hypothetical protein [Nigerium massiliense]
MTPASWHTTLAQALTGESLDLGVQESPNIAELVGALASRGWDAAAVRRHALDTQAAGLPWPHPVSPAARQGMGFAQWFAALARARTALGVDVLDVHAPSHRTTLTADERRLLAEVPPHHVR